MLNYVREYMKGREKHNSPIYGFIEQTYTIDNRSERIMRDEWAVQFVHTTVLLDSLTNTHAHYKSHSHACTLFEINSSRITQITFHCAHSQTLLWKLTKWLISYTRSTRLDALSLLFSIQPVA